MAHRKHPKNYAFFSKYDFYTPGPVDIIVLLFLLLGSGEASPLQSGEENTREEAGEAIGPRPRRG